ncbi:MAG: hypothetical protein ABI673_09910 [Novosphingobium sp.]
MMSVPSLTGSAASALCAAGALGPGANRSSRAAADIAVLAQAITARLASL